MNKTRIIKEIKKSKNILVVAHMNPDLDALCSQLSLAFYLQRLGRKFSLVNNCEVPSRYQFIGGTSKIKKINPRMKAEFDLAIILDCGELKRIGKVVDLISSSTRIMNIDHHISNEHFGDINYVDVASSSTSEIIYDLLKAAKCPMSKRLAVYFYVGILTDTGCFRYSNTSSKTHKVVSELMQFDFEPDKIYREIYESLPFDDFLLFANVVGNFEQFHDKRVICFEFDKKLQDKFSQAFDLRDTTLNFLRLVKGIELIIVFSAIDARRTRVNFRSTDKIDVAKLAEVFGGGGHQRASGCLMEKDMKAAKKIVLKAVKKLFEGSK